MNEILKLVILFLLVSLLIISSSAVLGVFYSIPSGNVALVKLDGELVSFGSVLGSQSSDDIISLLEAAEDNPNIEAIVLSINSVGGMSVASKEVSNKVLNLSKPVIAWIREVGTSGAYLIASSSDYIISDELSMVGSIGSTMSYLEFSETLTKYGVEYESLSSGDLKEMGSLFKNLTSEERELYMDLINASFEYFLNHVIEQRNLTSEALSIVSDGRVLSGSQAFNLGLVDELGSWNEVVKELELLNIKDVKVEEYSVSGFFPDFSSFLDFKPSSVFPTYD
ncbi:MAG: signal peptide peptidase SppA [Nanoarchaeota archaeon]|nr:signal peptide peptidase SppA [Nanoarchaeota archaeon]